MEDSRTCQNNTLSSEFYPKSPVLIPVLDSTLTQAQLNDQIHIPERPFQDVVHNVINVMGVEHYCRICGSEGDPVNLVGIFEERGCQLELYKNISNYLHLQVNKDDQLPQQVCNTCIFHLNICHQLFEVCHTTDSKLRQIFLLPQTKEDNGMCLNAPVDEILDLETLPQPEDTKDHSSQDANITDESRSADLIVVNCQPQGPVDSNSNECEVDKDENAVENEGDEIDKQISSIESLLCHICGKHFKSPSNLQAHKRTHLAESVKKQHHCSKCSKSFRSQFHLSEHMNVHNGVTPYSCPECAKPFYKRAQLRQHSQIHMHDSKKVVCEVCGLRFNRRSNLRAHVKTHAEDRTFDCRLCQKQFPTFRAMLSHRKQHSQEDIKTRLSLDMISNKERIFTCEVCGKIMTNKASLVTHLAQHKPGDSNCQHKCADCGKVLRSRRSLLYHQRSQHSAERPFHCSYCSEGFMTKKLLESHERMHTGEKPFKCETCWKGFRSRNNLSQHMLKHNGEKKFECLVCGKRFSRKGALTVHNRQHTGEKPFICDICGRPFSQKNDMLKHQKSHLEPNSRTHNCELCMSVFTSKSALVSHKETAHKDGIDIVPLIIANNMFETHIITEDGQKIVFTTVEALNESHLLSPSNI